ncbi:MAG: AAA family ATPase [Haloferacaceae archaeon]
MTRRLTVAAASDPADKHAGLPPAELDRIGIEEGDPVAVTGARRTAFAATVAEDAEEGTVALGGTGRDNAGVDPGESVAVEPVRPSPAERVALAPVNDLSLRGGDVLARVLRGRPVVAGDRVRPALFSGSLRLPFVVAETDPDGVVVVGEATEVVVRDDPAPDRDLIAEVPRRVRPSDLGGVDEEAALLTDLLVRPLDDPDRFDALGTVPTSGVLLYGPAGVGKTHLIHALATAADASYLPVDGADLRDRGVEGMAERLADLAARAEREAPTLVHLTDLDVLAPGGTDPGGADSRAASRVAAFLDRLADRPRVAVVGEAGSPEAIADPLLRGGRLEREVELAAPGRNDRAAILRVMARRLRLADDADLDAVAARTHGFVAADLGTLLREATLAAARRRRESVPDAEADEGPAVTAADLDAAAERVEPSAMGGFRVSVPETGYDDVGGLADAKRELVRAVEWPLRHPELFDRFGTTPPRGLLLHGPPGTGKTLLARAVASETDANFVSIDGPELLDKYVGESERAVRNVFAAARRNAPSVVFFDEIDAITTVRDDEDGGSRAPERVVSQLLTEIDGVEGLDAVTVVGATNRPDRIDPALLRPGRLDRVVEVPMPDRDARLEILRIHARGAPVGDVDLGAVADRTEGYTGSDIEALVREACLLAIEERLDAGGPDGTGGTVERPHFEAALDAVEPSVAPGDRAPAARPDERFGE